MARSVRNYTWGSGEKAGAGTEAAHAVLKDSLQSLPFLPLWAGKDHSPAQEPPPLHLGNKEED